MSGKLSEADICVTNDFIRKVSDDVLGILRRAMSIAPPPHLPIAAAAGAGCIGFLGAELQHLSEGGRVHGAPPDPECILLGALILARMGQGVPDAIGSAYEDLRILTEAGRAALSEE